MSIIIAEPISFYRKAALASLLLLTLVFCSAPPPGTSDATVALRDTLVFHAPFDDGPDAAFAKGDRHIYTAPSYEKQAEAVPGIGNPDVELLAQGGRFGGALRFNKKNTHALFYRAADHVSYHDDILNGTISFWLNLSPDEDLDPGYCDPIQLTDAAYNDTAVWVDFTKDDHPRKFRMGVFGDLEAWNPAGGNTSENPDFLNRLISMDNPPFTRGSWTQVVVTFEGIGAGSGTATLYLNGQPQGTATGIAEQFTWDLTAAALRLGVNYRGLFDELALFDRALSTGEVVALYQLADGVAELRTP